MQIDIQEIDYCRLNVNFAADPDQVENKRLEIINYFKKEEVPGFRKGKATNEAVLFHFKNKIEDALKNEMAQEAFYTVIAEKNIRPFGNPQFLSADLNNKDFKCSFAMNKVPEFELKQYKDFTIPLAPLPNAAEMSEKILQELRNKNGETIPFAENDFLQTGDAAIINYSGREEHSNIEIIKIDGELFTIGSSPIEAFNDNLLGMKIGDKRNFTANIPANTNVPELTDKSVLFEVELTMASKNTPAALDDNLAVKVGAKDNLLQLAQSSASARLEQLKRNYNAQQISQRLVEGHEFELPVWLTSFEAKLIAKKYEKDWETLNENERNDLLKIASSNVKLSLVLDKVRNLEPEAQLTDKELVGIIKENFLSEEDKKLPFEKVMNNLSETGKLQLLISHIKDEYTVDYIISHSKIVE